VIDVIIPAYRGFEDTRRCVESVIAARCVAAREVTVVDDASPEPEISAWLAAQAEAGRINLLRHASNRGFVASVNEGMARHPGRDVVLLNSDTEVADGWLDRLAAAALRDPAIGTVTPFSTNATILSYPRFHGPNALPRGETTATLDAAFAAANAGRAVDIPTAVGFCMMVRRACLARVGPFDEERYGRGYGEEVDFCMRATRLGFRHIAAGDVFVRHVGEVSFGGGGAERRVQAQATVDALYPEFQPRVREFVATDPLRGLRRRADLERLRRSPRPRRIVTAPAPGAADAELLLLHPAGPAHVELRWLAEGEEMALWFHVRDDWPAVLAILATLGAVDADSPPGIPELDPRWLFLPPAGATPGDAHLAAAHERIRALESSTSWRVTSPLRRLTQAFRSRFRGR
jgi:O-antigen biosynthesis protein